jgi:hypothetical protein
MYYYFYKHVFIAKLLSSRGINVVSKLKMGIIGCGRIGNNKHMAAIKTVPDVEIAAFCDIIRERAEASAALHGTFRLSLYAGR